MVVTEYSNNFTLKPFEMVSSWMPSALCDSATQPMFGDGRPGECTFPFFLFIQNPGHAPISIISVTKLTGDLL